VRFLSVSSRAYRLEGVPVDEAGGKLGLETRSARYGSGKFPFPHTGGARKESKWIEKFLTFPQKKHRN
jgi:hypothetical protein